MQIENLSSKMEVKNNLLGGRSSVASAMNVNPEGNNAAGDNEQLTLPLNVSVQRMGWLKFILDNFQETSLLSNIREILDLLFSIENKILDKEALDLLRAITGNLVPLKESLTDKEFSAALIKNIIGLYSNSEELKLNLLKLGSLLNNKEVQVSALKEKIGSFITYLESLNFLNKEGMKDNVNNQVSLYFPFTVASESGKDKSLELIIYPEFDKDGKARDGIISFAIVIETDHLGEIRVFFKVVKSEVSCSVTVENPATQGIIRKNKDNLVSRLKKKKFILNKFDCGLVDRQEEYLPSMLPHLELKA